MPTISCCVCGAEVTRPQKEINRSMKLGRRTYCSRRCCGLDNIDSNIPVEKRPDPKTLNLKGRPTDDLSPFRWHHHNLRTHSAARGRPGDVQVSVQDLKDLWDLQEGRCPYTGWALVNPLATSNSTKVAKTPDRASVDRIDSSQGYVKGNIQFVALIAQYAKNDFTEANVREFCEAVVKAPYKSQEDNIHAYSRAFRTC